MLLETKDRLDEALANDKGALDAGRVAGILTEETRDDIRIADDEASNADVVAALPSTGFKFTRGLALEAACDADETKREDNTVDGIGADWEAESETA
jgi:hypothetical protein